MKKIFLFVILISFVTINSLYAQAGIGGHGPTYGGNLGATSAETIAKERDDVWLSPASIPYIKPSLTVAANNSGFKSSADYVCDGVDDQVQINAAINACPSVGGSIFLYPGTYNVTDEILIDADNVRLCADRNAIINVQQIATTLAANVTAGPVATISVASATGFLENQVIKIGDGTNFETRSIAGINGNILTLGAGRYTGESGNFTHSYVVGDNVTTVFDIIRIGHMSPATSVDRITIDGIYIDGNVGDLIILGDQ